MNQNHAFLMNVEFKRGAKIDSLFMSFSTFEASLQCMFVVFFLLAGEFECCFHADGFEHEMVDPVQRLKRLAFFCVVVHRVMLVKRCHKLC